MSDPVTPKQAAMLHLQGVKADLNHIEGAYRAFSARDTIERDTLDLARACLVLIRCIELQDKEIKELKEALCLSRK